MKEVRMKDNVIRTLHGISGKNDGPVVGAWEVSTEQARSAGPGGLYYYIIPIIDISGGQATAALAEAVAPGP